MAKSSDTDLSWHEMEREFQRLARETTGPLPIARTAAHEKAEALMDKAYAASKGRGTKFARQALEVLPDCMEAMELLGDCADSLKNTLLWYERGVDTGERIFSSFIAEIDSDNDLKNHFLWGIYEARPFVRCMVKSAQCLWYEGRRDDAIARARRALHLSHSDDIGMRYGLLPMLITERRFSEASELIATYHQEFFPQWMYSTALLEFLKDGRSGAATKALREALSGNPLVPEYLLGLKPIPRERPHTYAFGSKEEAIIYAVEAAAAWKAFPEALEWLADELIPAAAAKRKAARRRKTGEAAEPVTDPTGSNISLEERVLLLASELLRKQPWEEMDDEKPVAFQHPMADELGVALITGILGQMLGVVAYPSVEAYHRTADALPRGDGVIPQDAVFLQDAVVLEFVNRKELRPGDRKLLAEGHWPGKRGKVPVIRVYRPGFHPGSPDRASLLLLSLGLYAVLAHYDDILNFEIPEPDEEGTLPLYEIRIDHLGFSESALEEVRQQFAAGREMLTMPGPINFSFAEIKQVREASKKVKGAWEIQCLFLPDTATVHPSGFDVLPRFGVIVDHESGISPWSGLIEPQQNPMEMLYRGVLDAVRKTGVRPSVVKVRDRSVKDFLGGALEAMGAYVQVQKRLPGVEQLYAAIMKTDLDDY